MNRSSGRRTPKPDRFRPIMGEAELFETPAPGREIDARRSGFQRAVAIALSLAVSESSQIHRRASAPSLFHSLADFRAFRYDLNQPSRSKRHPSVSHLDRHRVNLAESRARIKTGRRASSTTAAEVGHTRGRARLRIPAPRSMTVRRPEGDRLLTPSLGCEATFIAASFGIPRRKGPSPKRLVRQRKHEEPVLKDPQR
jgi:hypothetical protein